MNWDLLDFLAFGVMIGTVLLIVLIARRSSKLRSYRAAALIAAIGAFLMVWSNAAVGIIGNEENGANMLFYGVLAVPLLGALFSRLRARGMVIALFATFAAQLIVAAVALLLDLGADGPSWPRDILTMTSVFCVFWLVSGWLFNHAARQQRRLFVD